MHADEPIMSPATVLERSGMRVLLLITLAMSAPHQVLRFAVTQGGLNNVGEQNQ
jgi:hypothetical protein